MVIHRADLQAVLIEKAESIGVQVKLGSIVTSLDFSEPSVRLQNGENCKADVVLGCDGEKSTCREALLGRSDPPCLSGAVVFRITLGVNEILKHQDLADLMDLSNVNAWFGPDAHAVSYLLKKNDLVNLLLTCSDRSDRTLFKTPKVNIHELSEVFVHWDPRFRKLFEIAHEASRWTLHETNETRKWTHDEGVFTLLGDAAHAALPYL